MDVRTRIRLAWAMLFQIKGLGHLQDLVLDEIYLAHVDESRAKGAYVAHKSITDKKGFRCLFLAEHDLASITMFDSMGRPFGEVRGLGGSSADRTLVLEMDQAWANVGIGTAVMEWALELLAGRITQETTVKGDVASGDPPTPDDDRRLHFYRKLGFEIHPRTPTGYGISKRISPILRWTA